jgi:hypothetical protein
MPSMSISQPRLSTGTMARILNGPCRLTGADGNETSIETSSSRMNFLYLLYHFSSAIADGRMREVAFKLCIVSTLTKTSIYKFLILVGSAMPRGYDETSLNITLLVHLSIIHPAFRGLGFVIQNRIAMEDLGDNRSKGLLFGLASETCSPYQT